MYRDWNRHAVHMEPPKEILTSLQLPEKTLMGPGPSNCSRRVLDALHHQVLGNLHTETYQLMDEIKVGLQYAFQTKNRLTLALSASGHGGMEACLGNLLEPNETILIVKSGFWSERAADMARRIGARVEFLTTQRGVGFDLNQMQSALEKSQPAAVFVVHGDSSTGLKQPLEGLGDLVHKYNALLIVDTVASLGGEPFFMDSWNVDAVYSGSQKVLGAPPGLAPLSFNPRAERKLFRRRTKVPVFYWDLTILGDYWNCFGNERIYHHTISTTLMYGLREALSQLAKETLPVSWARHAAAAVRLRKGLELRGLYCYVKIPQYQLSTIIPVELPPGVDGNLVSKIAMEKFKLEIAGGLGPTAGKVLRIGVMGINATAETVDLLLRALDEGLKGAVESKL